MVRLISSLRFSSSDLGLVLGLKFSLSSTLGSEKDLDSQQLTSRQACLTSQPGDTTHQLNSLPSTWWYSMELESTSMRIYWASFSIDLMMLLSANSSRMFQIFSSVFLMEQIMAKGNSNTIVFTLFQSQFSSRGYEYWKGVIRFVRNRADMVATASVLLMKMRVFWQNTAVSISSISSQEKLEKKTGQQARAVQQMDLGPGSGIVPKQLEEWQQIWLYSGLLAEKQSRIPCTSSFFSRLQTLLARFQELTSSLSISTFLSMTLLMISCSLHSTEVWIRKQGQQVTITYIFSLSQTYYSTVWQLFSRRMCTKSGSRRHTTNRKQLELHMYSIELRRCGCSRVCLNRDSSPFRVKMKQSSLRLGLGLYSMMSVSYSVLHSDGFFFLRLHPQGKALLAISLMNSVFRSLYYLPYMYKQAGETTISYLFLSAPRLFLNMLMSGPMTRKDSIRFYPFLYQSFSEGSRLRVCRKFRMLVYFFALVDSRMGWGTYYFQMFQVFSQIFLMLAAVELSPNTPDLEQSSFSQGRLAISSSFLELERVIMFLGSSRLVGCLVRVRDWKFLQLVFSSALRYCSASILVSSSARADYSSLFSLSSTYFSFMQLSNMSSYYSSCFL